MLFLNFPFVEYSPFQVPSLIHTQIRSEKKTQLLKYYLNKGNLSQHFTRLKRSYALFLDSLSLNIIQDFQMKYPASMQLKRMLKYQSSNLKFEKNALRKNISCTAHATFRKWDAIQPFLPIKSQTVQKIKMKVQYIFRQYFILLIVKKY